jgi:hypothetical protein
LGFGFLSFFLPFSCCFYVIRLVKTITEVVGEFNLSGTEFSSSAAAIHAKCLLCDKPVSSQRARTASDKNNMGGGRQTMILSKSYAHVGGNYDKNDDDFLQQQLLLKKKNGGNMIKRAISPDPLIAKSAKAKIVSDVAIIRSTIEPLPEIHVSFLFPSCVVPF